MEKLTGFTHVATFPRDGEALIGITQFKDNLLVATSRGVYTTAYSEKDHRLILIPVPLFIVE